MTLVGKKSFIIMTLLIPFLILIVGSIPVLMAYINSSADTSVTRIAVIDESGKYGAAFKNTPNYRFVIMQGDKKVNAHTLHDIEDIFIGTTIWSQLLTAAIAVKV